MAFNHGSNIYKDPVFAVNAVGENSSSIATSWRDLSDNPHDAAKYGDASYGVCTGSLDAGIPYVEFAESYTSYLDLGTSLVMDEEPFATNGMTIQYYVYLNALNDNSMFGQNASANTGAWFYSDGRPGFFINGGSNLVIAAKANDGGTVTSHKWMYIANVYDKPGGKLYIYMNGVKANEAACTANIAYNNASTKICRLEGVSGYSGNCRIGQYEIYSRALSATEIAEFFENTRGRYKI